MENENADSHPTLPNVNGTPPIEQNGSLDGFGDRWKKSPSSFPKQREHQEKKKMASKLQRPQTAVSINTYLELDEYVIGFINHFNLLMVIGPPGTQKSQSLRKAIGEEACWLEGNVTAHRMYCELYHHRNKMVVIDDVDSLYRDCAAVRLLKCLCQTDPVKSIAWHSSSLAMQREGIPHQFTTTSRVAIIANDWRTMGENVLAIEDRGHVVLFEPDAYEIHSRTSQWFRDQEIFDFVGQQLDFLEQPSMRLYVKAAELKRAGMNWHKFVLSRCLSGPALLVASLKADNRFGSEAERVEAFIKQGGGQRSTYFYHAKRLPQRA
jgi:hypothetical protein